MLRPVSLLKNHFPTCRLLLSDPDSLFVLKRRTRIMEQHSLPTMGPADDGGWTRERRVRFLRCLADTGNVRRACAAVGLSRQSVYKLRCRDAEFGRVWSVAVEVARETRIRRYLAALGARPAGVSPCGIER